MNIVNFSLNRPVTISMIFIAALILGITSLINLTVELMPNTNLGRMSITTYIRGGLPSEEVEKRIAKPMEEALGDTSYLKNILTISKEGENTVVLEFEPEANMNYVSMEVREKLSKARNKLPREAERPIVMQYGYGEAPIIAASFTSNKYTPEELRKMLETNLKKRFSRIEGVARIETVGGREEKIIIELDEKKMAALALSFREVLNILGTSNINLIGGDILWKDAKYMVRCKGEFTNLDDINNLGIKAMEEGGIIRLKDIGEAKLSYLETREIGRINFKPSVTFYLFKKSLSNTLKICQKAEIEAIKIGEELKDKHIEVVIPFNHGEFIKKSIKDLKNSLFLGSAMAVLILFLFLRSFYAVSVLALSLPFSIFITFSLMYLLGVSLNVMSLAGLCLGAGQLLDSSIVVMENIFKSKERTGIIDKQEVSRSTNQVSLAIFASVVTTLIVFLPFIFLNKETQRLYNGLVLTISFSLIASLFISISLVPVLCNLLLRKKGTIDQPFFRKIENGYKKSLNLILTLRYIIIGLCVLGIIVTFSLSQKLEKEFIGMPEEDQFTIFVQLPTGTKIEVTDKIVKRVEALLEKHRKDKIVKHYTTHIETYSTQIYVQLTPLMVRKMETYQIIEELRKKTEAFQPAFIYYEEPQEAESKEIILEFLGYDYDILKDLARESGGHIKNIEGLTDVKLRMREGGPQVDIILDKEMLAFWELNMLEASTELHGKLRGLIPTHFHPKEDSFLSLTVKDDKKTQEEKDEELSLPMFSKEAAEIEIIARIQEKYRKRFKDLEDLTFIVNERPIRLSQIAVFKSTLSPSEIWRKNKKRMVQVSANRGRVPLSKVAREVTAKLKNVKFPEGYNWRFGESYEKLVKNQRELSLAFLFAIILVYMSLAAMFENLLQPFIILSTIPLAGIGSVTLLYLKKEPVGIGVLIGALMLVGIVVNNAIILIDWINSLRREKFFSARTAALEAAASRLRPILMTTLTTILPLLPLVLFKSEASPLWTPLALTVISGLTVSCVLSLYVVPCLYLVLSKK